MYYCTMSSLQKKISQRLRMLRAEKGFSQEQVALDLDLSPNGYAKIERGETDISLSKVEKFSNYFNVEITYLLGLNDSGKNMINNGTQHVAYQNSSIVNDNTYIKTILEELAVLKEKVDKLQKNSL